MKLSAKGFDVLFFCTHVHAMTGGHEIPTTTHPETVYLTSKGSQCTGTLIAPKWVLTAAHCLEQSLEHPSFVRIIFAYFTEKKRFGARRFYMHPSEDLALVELEEEYPAPPALLVEAEQDTNTIPKYCKTVGFGTPFNVNGKYQEDLDGSGIAGKRMGRIHLIGKKDQYLKTRATPFWLRRLIPVAGKNAPVQVASGDSGGPLFCDGKLTGVTIQGLESYWIGGSRLFKSQSFFLDLRRPDLNEWIQTLVKH